MIRSFVKPAVPVRALQYDGNQSNVQEIFNWLGGLFYIQRGEDHELRYVHELDEEGRALTTAPPFLVIRTQNGEDRCDVTDWIVQDDYRRVSVYNEINFGFTFEKAGV